MNGTPTPRTDAAFREMGRLAAKWKCGDLHALAFTEETRKPYEDIQQLERELAEARKDKERLDWMEGENCFWVEIARQPDGETVYQGHPDSGDGSIRAAIDAAMKEGKDQRRPRFHSNPDRLYHHGRFGTGHPRIHLHHSHAPR